jgi:hypothetical protein
MRPSVLFCLLAAAVLVGTIEQGHAQSPYNYSWCGVYGGKFGGGARSCYYNSYEQCIATMRTAGGYCIQNPAYQGPAAGTAQPRRQRRANPS